MTAAVRLWKRYELRHPTEEEAKMKMAALRGPKMMVHIVNKNENALKSIICRPTVTPGKLTRKAMVTETIMQR